MVLGHELLSCDCLECLLNKKFLRHTFCLFNQLSLENCFFLRSETVPLKIQSVVENAIREQLEDEIDLATYDERKNEAEISLTAVLKKLKK